MKKHIFIILIVVIASTSCDYFKKEQNTKVIARVNDHYLYKKDLDALVSDKFSASDSAMRVKSYIDNWAVKKIMLDKSKFNLPEDKQQKFDSLAQDYQDELYREAYKNALINQKIDTDISDSSLKKYYNERKKAFKINEYLLKLRYIELVNSMNNKDLILEKFWRFNQDDQLFLSDNTLALKSYILADSIWVRSVDIFRQLKDLDSINEKQFYRANDRFSLKDSTSTYYFKINKVKEPNSPAPYSFIKPKIKQILINRKKLTLGAQIEEEIKADAYENESFEIYD